MFCHQRKCAALHQIPRLQALPTQVLSLQQSTKAEYTDTFSTSYLQGKISRIVFLEHTLPLSTQHQQTCTLWLFLHCPKVWSLSLQLTTNQQVRQNLCVCQIGGSYCIAFAALIYFEWLIIDTSLLAPSASTSNWQDKGAHLFVNVIAFKKNHFLPVSEWFSLQALPAL